MRLKMENFFPRVLYLSLLNKMLKMKMIFTFLLSPFNYLWSFFEQVWITKWIFKMRLKCIFKMHFKMHFKIHF